MKKGFTLIELLAVIVILAIIALIAVPIVVTIIDDSTNSATLASGKLYVDAVENAIMNKNLDTGGNFYPNECLIKDDGNLVCDGIALTVEVDGEKPTEGYFVFDEGVLKNAEMSFDDIIIATSDEGVLVNVEDGVVCKRVTEETRTTGKIPTGEYLPGDEYICEVKDEAEYHFFVVGEEGDKVNLILDRNINNDGTLATKSILEASPEKGIYSRIAYYREQDTTKGPITSMEYIENATKNWDNIENLNETYNDKFQKYTNFKITSKARLPKYDEVYGEGKCTNTKGSCPLWLSSYLSYTGLPGMNGYWLMDTCGSNSKYASFIHTDRYYAVWEVNYKNNGVRPVISVSKKDMYSGTRLNSKICNLVDGEANAIGSKYQCKVKDNMETGFEDGYYFFVLGTNSDGTTNLIMERNMYYDESNDVGVVATSSNSNVAWYANEANNSYGPVTAMNYLHNATKDWKNIQNISVDYDESRDNPGAYGYGSMKTSNNITTITSRSGSVTATYENLKARLPKLSEVDSYDSLNGTNAYLYNYMYMQNNGIQTDAIDGIYGYWTLSTMSNESEYPTAWCVQYDGSRGFLPYGDSVVFSDYAGVRPVITVKL